MSEIDDVIARMREREDRLEELGYRIRFDIKGSGSILLDATGSDLEISEDQSGEADADTVLVISYDNLIKLVSGKLSPMLAFSTGRLKVRGSQGVALKLAGLLDAD
ncbi:SCP2 sterol-binding domain-containing protein [Martelella mediterranea]|uniref:SCP-2 sterol transfer family protein n=1 Tax=Martelella mediterranea TaxID=293089 RepID=A0A4R3NXS2_9HYPH|nr:SCP2 sterol-binding domain-containing protein [Martelella mediterranea]TCT44936.1 SCP-2 sterol transfer family protein [Martelella mediterranea]